MRLRRLFCFLLASLLFICGVFSVSVSASDIVPQSFSFIDPDTFPTWASTEFSFVVYNSSSDKYALYNCNGACRLYFQNIRDALVLGSITGSGNIAFYKYISNGSSWGSGSYSSGGFFNVFVNSSLETYDQTYLVYSSIDIYDDNGDLFYAVSMPSTAADPVFTQDLPEGTGTVPYTVNYTVGQAAEPLTVAAESTDGGTITYQWYQYGDVSSVVIENATSASYTPPTDTAGEVTYYCEVKNTISSGAAAVKNSNHVKVVVSAVPVPTPDPDDPYPGIQDGIDNIGNQITELPGEIGDRVDQAADNLGNKLLDGIKGLFVPDEEDIADIKDKWEQLLSDRFGAVYESATIIDSIIDAFVYNGDMETISFPSATIDLAGTPFTFGGWKVEVIPERFRFLTITSKLITSIVCTVLFVNGMKKKLEGLLSA